MADIFPSGVARCLFSVCSCRCGAEHVCLMAVFHAFAVATHSCCLVRRYLRPGYPFPGTGSPLYRGVVYYWKSIPGELLSWETSCPGVLTFLLKSIYPADTNLYFPPTHSSFSLGYGAEPRAPKVLSLLSHYVRLLRTWKIWRCVEKDLNNHFLEEDENTLM